jgi:hypothetical protein
MLPPYRSGVADRILVKRQYSRASDLPKEYNDFCQRKVPADRSEHWEELLVVLRMGRVEIWEEWVSSRLVCEDSLKWV